MYSLHFNMNYALNQSIKFRVPDDFQNTAEIFKKISRVPKYIAM